MNKVIANNKGAELVDISSQLDPLRLKLLLEQSRTSVMTNLGMSLVTAWMLYSFYPMLFALSWLALSCLINVARLFLTQYIKAHSSDLTSQQAVFYENVYACVAFVSGAIWGVLGWNMNLTMPFMQQYTIPLIMTGMSAGAVYCHMSSVKTFRAFVLPMGLPLVFDLYLSGYQLESISIFIYLIAIFILANKVYIRVIESLSLRYENKALIDNLQRTNIRQTELIKDIAKKETFLQHSFEQAGIPMWLIGADLRIIDLNKAACELLDCSRQNLLKSDVNRLLHRSSEQDIHDHFLSAMTDEKYQIKFTQCFSGKNDAELWLYSILSAVMKEDGELDYYVMQAQDITREYALNQNLHYLTHHDSLTGLQNRFAFEDKIKQLLLTQSEQQHVFCYLDLDMFKIVNEACGRVAGNQLLLEFSQQLKAGLPGNCFLARFDGDEFAILAVNSTLDRTQASISILMDRVRKKSFSYEGDRFNVTASIGMAAFDSSSNMMDILKQGELACFAAKEMGRDRIHIYRDDDENLSQRSGDINWLTRIQKALESDKLVLFQQRIEHLNHGQDSLPHCEMLIRMYDEDGSIISPGHFLPAAERYNMAASIDLWTVKHVLMRLETAQQAGQVIRGVYAINLSGQSLGDSRFYEQIIEMIQTSTLNQYGAQLCFEVTETAAITNMGDALKFIEEMKKVGCLFALDDFGSGLSSFAYLKELPVDYLKIDGMFVRDCLLNSVNMEIINSINGIGQVLGLQTIVECVEDEATMNAMRDLGVDYIQGFHIAKPQPWAI